MYFQISIIDLYIYVVVNFLSQLIFVSIVLGMVMYANEFKTKEK